MPEMEAGISMRSFHPVVLILVYQQYYVIISKMLKPYNDQ